MLVLLFQMLVLGEILFAPVEAQSQGLIIAGQEPNPLHELDTFSKQLPYAKRTSRMHFTTGYEFWSADRFDTFETIERSSILGDFDLSFFPTTESAVCYEVAVSFPRFKLGDFPITIGAGIEQLHHKKGGGISVDEITTGWLGETYYGEFMVLTTDLLAYSLIGSINLKPYKPKHVFGYSARVFGSVRYFDINEIETVTMQGNYHINGTTGELEFQTEVFQRTMPADKIALEAGGRLELHASRFISIILPQLTLRGTIYRKKIPATVYVSELDGDKIDVSERKSSYSGLFLMVGIGLHL